jgi:hypothetical protein
MSLQALPSSYRSSPVIPLAPNARGDRPHQWDWTNDTTTIPSGLTITKTLATVGVETFPLEYVGLTRADARTIEQFFEDRQGRKEGFWCPTFQQDFFSADFVSGQPSGTFPIREWGYATEIFPLGTWATHFAAYRAATSAVKWYFAPFTIPAVSTIVNAAGEVLKAYNYNGAGDIAGNVNVVSVGAGNTHSNGLRLSRLLWVRFVDDAITTEWAHPNHASISLRVTAVPAESP